VFSARRIQRPLIERDVGRAMARIAAWAGRAGFRVARLGGGLALKLKLRLGGVTLCKYPLQPNTTQVLVGFPHARLLPLSMDAL
jgi:hypothetical protein